MPYIPQRREAEISNRTSPQRGIRGGRPKRDFGGLPNKNTQPSYTAELDSCVMAWAEGLEPPTVGLENRCSIQLS